MKFPTKHAGYMDNDGVRSTVQEELEARGWTYDHAGWSSFATFKKGAISLSFRYDRGDRWYSSETNPPTQIQMSFSTHDYGTVIRKVSYKNFTFEWADKKFLELSHLLELDLQQGAAKEEANRTWRRNHDASRELAEELGLEIEGNKNTEKLKLFDLSVKGVTEEQVRQIAKILKEGKE